MKKAFLLLALPFAFMGCTKSSTPSSPTPVQQVGCAVETAVASAISAVAAQQLQCTGTAAIQASILAAATKANVNLCPTAPATVAAGKVPAEKSAIGNAICPGIVSSLLGAAQTQIPAAWSCSAATLSADLSAKLITACEGAI